MASPADFVWTEGVAPSREDYDGLGHVGNAAIARILADARTHWFAGLRERDPEPRVIVVRMLTISYENEAPLGVPLRCGVRALSHGTTSITLAHCLWRTDDGMTVADGTAVHVCFDVERRMAVPIWPAMVAAVEHLQGAPLPLVGRTPP